MITIIQPGQIWQDRLCGRQVKVLVADPEIISIETIRGEGERFCRYHTGNFRAMFYLLPDNIEIRYRKPGTLSWKRRMVTKAHEVETRQLLTDAGMEVR